MTNLLPTARYDVWFTQQGGVWSARCSTLDIEAQGPTRDLARNALYEQVRTVVVGDHPADAAGDEVADSVYAEQMAVTRLLNSALLGPVGGVLPPHGPYEDDEGNLFLRDSLVAVVDELGTSETWLAGFNDDQLQERKVRLDETVARVAAPVAQGIESTVSYTDNVLHAVPIDGDLSVSLVSVAMTVGQLQLNLTIRGTLVRGGIATGPHHASPGLIVGPALVKAHKIEQLLARAPRVLLEDVVARDATDVIIGRREAAEHELLQRLLLVDTDGGMFVSYLDIPDIFEDEPGERTKATLLQHRDAVQHGLTGARNAAHAAKWRWAAIYHNFIVAEFDATADLGIAEDPTLRGQIFSRVAPEQG